MEMLCGSTLCCVVFGVRDHEISLQLLLYGEMAINSKHRYCKHRLMIVGLHSEADSNFICDAYVFNFVVVCMYVLC